MKIAIAEFPGSHGAVEVEHIYRRVLGQEVVRVWHQEEMLPGDVDILVIPGGASFGDYLRPGALARGSQIVSAIRKFARENRPTLAIGNGFQILCEIGVLPGALLPNAGMKFLKHDPYIMVEHTDSPFLKGFEEGQVIRLPVACYFGRYYGDKRVLQDLEEGGRVALRYCDKFGDVDPQAPFNGCSNAIAGITSRHHNVLGLMAHPERAAEAWLGSTEGLTLLEGPLRS
jgi:phosphoribosylformylglycinamidine synthase